MNYDKYTEPSLMISAFLDGELNEEETRFVENRLQSGDPIFIREFEALEKSRSHMRDFLQLALSPSANVDLWPRIFPKLETSSHLNLLQSSLKKVKKFLVDFSFDGLSIDLIFARYVVATLLVLTATFIYIRDNNAPVSQLTKSNLTKSTHVRSANNLQPLNRRIVNPNLVLNVSSRSTSDASQNSFGEDYRQMLEGRLGVPVWERTAQFHKRIQSSVFRTPSRVRAEIEWIESDRSFTVLRARDTAKPLIWLARR